MKTAGIVTYWVGDFNYGTKLQNYAVEKVLEKYNIRGTLIRYFIYGEFSGQGKLMAYLKKYGIAKTFCHIFIKFLTIPYQRFAIKKDKLRNFASFSKKNICQTDRIYSSEKDIKENLPKMDLYIAGSDQIWNVSKMSIDYAKREIPIVFLSFVPKNAVRMAFSASFGSEKFNSPFNEQIGNLLKNFDYISVRERSGVSICSELGVDDAQYQLDPTFLLTKEDYRILYDETLPSKIAFPIPA